MFGNANVLLFMTYGPKDEPPVSTARKYGTRNPVLIEARIDHDPADEFSWVQEWRFAIAQFLADSGEYVPEFQGAESIREELPYAVLDNLYPDYPDRGIGTEVAELRYALNILDRYREWLRIAGRDY